MKFNELEYKPIQRYNEPIIYFLLKNDEVKYVGKSSKGLIRALSHKDKEFNKINVIYCRIEELDDLENKYISKYNPLYNKKPNENATISIQQIKREFSINGLKTRISYIRKILYDLGVFIRKDFGYEYIKRNEYNKIKEILYARCEYERF